MKSVILHRIRSWLPTLLLLFFVFSFVFVSDESFDQDLGRHLKLGEIIWQTHHVPKANLFSYTNPDFPFINHHWLFEVFAYGTRSLLGLEGLLVIKIAILLGATGIILFLAKKTQSIFFLPLSFLTLHMLRGRVELRPEIFSFLFTVVVFYILEKFDEHETKLIYLLPIISLIWVNTHIYYPVGLFLQGIYLVHYAVLIFFRKQKNHVKRLKKIALIFAISLLATLINPNFLNGALYAFTVFTNYGVTIAENQTMATLQSSGFVDPDFLFAYVCFLLVLTVVMLGAMKNALTVKHSLLLLLGVGLCLQSIRGFPYMIFPCLPVLLSLLPVSKGNIWSKGLDIVIAILILLESFYYLSGMYYNLTYRNHSPSLVATEDAKSGLDFLLAHNLPQPIFNNFDIGSYIIYRTYPKYKVFIDGRPEAYPAKFFTDEYIPLQENYNKFKKESKKFDFKTVVFSITDQNPRTLNFLRNITKDKEWKLVYLDQMIVIYVKRSESTKLAEINLTKFSLNSYHYTNVVAYTNLSTFLFNMHEFTQAKVFNQQALRISPQNPAANKIMANILLTGGNANIPLVYEYLAKTNNGIFW